MMKITVSVLTLLILLLGSMTTLAQDDEERDVMELSLFGGVSSPTGGVQHWNDSLGAKAGYQVGFEFGYFLSPSWVLGVGFSFSRYSVDLEQDLDELSHKFYNPSLYLKYYMFGDGNLVPYFKGTVGVDNPKFTTGVMIENQTGATKHRELSYDAALAFGLTAGAFYYTSDYSGLFLDVTLHHALTKNSSAEYAGTTYDFKEQVWSADVRVGVNIYFGSDE